MKKWSGVQGVFLSMALAVFAEEKETLSSSLQPGEVVKEGQLPAGYLQSAAYQGSSWDVYLTADYICWKWNQPITPILVIDSADSILEHEFISKKTTVSDLHPQYSSGFQVGLGCNMKGMDHWNAYAEYTWYQNNASSTFTTGKDQYFTNMISGGQFSLFNQAGMLYTQAKMSLDALDVFLQRAFYLGKRLVSTLGLGFSNLWITQHVSNIYDVRFVKFAQKREIYALSTVQAKQSSWGIGPKLQFNADFLVGYGLKFVGNFAVSVLYTKYRWKRDLEVALTGTSEDRTIHSDFFFTQGPYNFLPITEAALGLGWGTYLCDNRFHLDLSVLYDVNVYWNYTTLGLIQAENMMLHGLNLGARFDF
ncbi:MAG: hypothetical protein FJZ58_07540 [Chlamydiae bacterium]|nr:hypothetical protein [Chlamydiota bacterium]